MIKERHIALLLLSAFMLFLATTQEPTPPIQPRLIAQGCEGAGGDLWAMDEFDFPTTCQHIESWR